MITLAVTTTGATVQESARELCPAGLPKLGSRGLFESERADLPGSALSMFDPVTATNGPDCLASLISNMRTLIGYATD